jgi:hypothetical protein
MIGLSPIINSSILDHISSPFRLINTGCFQLPSNSIPSFVLFYKFHHIH